MGLSVPMATSTSLVLISLALCVIDGGGGEPMGPPVSEGLSSGAYQSANQSVVIPPIESPTNATVTEATGFDLEGVEEWSGESKPKNLISLTPTVTIVILVRNKAHALPNFLAFIDLLNYPKSRMSIFIRSDHNVDNSTHILKEWIGNVKNFYHSIDASFNETKGGYSGEKNTMDWPDERFTFLMGLRQTALEYARRIWSDYVFFVDADNLLENHYVIRSLVRLKKTVVAPMLVSLGRYSNWWGDMTEGLYYRRSADYMEILNRIKTGVFLVPMVHSTFLVDLRRKETEKLSFLIDRDYKGPFDDVIIFAYNARIKGINFWLTNEEHFGKLVGPLDSHHGVEDDRNSFMNTKLESLFEDPPMPITKFISKPLIPKSKWGFDEIYLVNLKRRPDRLQRMLACFDELGIEAKMIEAVDGHKLSKSYLEALDIRQCPNYRDPYSGRDMTFGEIGCFMSHYKIWEDVVTRGHNRVIVFEDDIRFELYFKIMLFNVMMDAKKSEIDWDLIYLGRKRLRKDLEPQVQNTETLVWPSYSYWTLSYILSGSGAHKLLNQRPLNRLVPVDEYLPIMFDRHPDEGWKSNFHPRDLVALSAEPLLCYPTHYTGEKNYISDTEDSQVIPDEHIADPTINTFDEQPEQQHHKTAKSIYAEASTDVKDEL